MGKRIALMKDGLYHCEDGPALVTDEGDQFWFFNGMQHRTDGPAVVLLDGRQLWCLNGEHYEPTEWLLKLHELGLG